MIDLIGLLLPQGLDADLPSFSPELYASVKQVALNAERLGFDSIWLNDHLMSQASGGNYPCLECWTTLAALAAGTTRIRLGPMVTCNSYRHPALVAKMASTLDNLSNGRFELGIGTGWYKREYLAYGYHFPEAAARVKMLQESVVLIKRMWTEDKVTFVGEYYKTREASCEPKPIQRPNLPIWVGGSGSGVLRLAARHGDGCNIIADQMEFKSKLQFLRNYCRQIGRNYDEIRKSLYGVVVIGRHEKEVHTRFNRYISMSRVPLRSRISIGLRHPAKVISYIRARQVKHSSSPGWIIGTPEECSAMLLKYVRIGVTDFVLYVAQAIEHEPLELFADEVIPSLKRV